jgi:hypothetical protein
MAGTQDHLGPTVMTALTSSSYALGDEPSSRQEQERSYLVEV